jgi:hypothetical protein
MAGGDQLNQHFVNETVKHGKLQKSACGRIVTDLDNKTFAFPKTVVCMNCRRTKVYKARLADDEFVKYFAPKSTQGIV